MAFLLMGFIFIPIGLVTLRASHSVIEIVDRYDTECVPEVFKSNKLSYIKNSSIPKNCSLFLKVHKYMKAPIYIYYQLDNYYQNHRRYVKSRSDRQLLHGLKHNDTTSCQPEESNHGLPIVPCGLIAWSFFNDTFKFIRERTELMVNRKNIAWKSDRDHKFGKQVYPFNFQNGTFTGGGSLDPSIPLSDQEDLIVWMRTAALPSFRKLYGRIEEDLDEGDLLVVHVMNNYNTYSFGGKKKLVLSTLSWLGGKNDFLGLAYVFIGCSSIIISIVFMLLHVKNPRAYGETAYLSWNRKSISG
ncbi:putative ALA-interacting subunit 2 isoform X2 [Pistacia vera]|uniref:putative ALA-interacting subunit 2 isoform X2 n=1 Tax=Pistacia vera TaxID=55513 RepID=UPI001263791C|nr:putative ALA-interacting subunit 2 isoform X2 [Pistacia vera]XP_031254753.1 putative ALA-interacting subunit 2 isoform X2 [Pistacia vera]XP_031254754.1 putative ALA-interacting subunit 2 isoform X2 [Pistacia vera]